LQRPSEQLVRHDGAPVAGGFADEYLHGHAPFVRDRMRE
jgi:hypothetical protein